MPRKVVGITAGVVALLIATLLPASPAGAVVRPGAPGTVHDANTQLILSGTGPGTSVSGFIADPSNPFDPTTGYPTTPPPPGTGWTAQDESFAGVIFGSPSDGSPALKMYCINIRTDTFVGVGYQLGTWDSANVANIGYVARLLNTYYPETNEPATLTDVNQKAAAVQAAVWFFSDRYVLSTTDPLRSDVAAIVQAVIAAGPIVEPPPPTLSITPSTLAGPIGSVIGPFTVGSTTVGEATVSAVGGTMYSDASAATVIPDGTTVPDGTKIWVRSTGPLAVAILATATATVPSGNAYLYDQNTPGLADAQKLILAQEATLRTTVSASAQFQLPGSLTVTKTITGPAAGHQGQVVIQVVCDGVALSPDFIIFSGTGAGDRSRVFSPIDAGSVCQVIETQDGHSSTVTVTTTGDGDEVTIPPDGNVGVHLTDTYDFVPGSLIVNKSIEGPAAGHQGPITIHVVCNGVAQSPDFQIPAGATGEPSHQYDDIPAGSVCTITEPDNGTNAPEVAPPTTVLTGPVTVPAAQIAEATVTDTYDFNPGTLVVNKSITGTPGGPVVITVTCEDPEGNSTTLSPPVSIPPGPDSQTYTGIAGNSRCTALEDPDGSSSSISVEKGGDPQATVPPGGSASIDLTNTYVTGLVVNKIIEGPAAGRQGALTINTACEFGGVTTPLTPIDIPANAPAGITTRDYPGIVAGSVCTTSETSAANPANVEVATTVTPTQPVTVPTGDAATVDVTDDYTFVPGSLVVTKEIAGPTGGQQGVVTIQVSCVDENGNQLDPGSLTLSPNAGIGAHDSTFAVPSGSVCTVTEVEDGSTQTVTVTTSGSPTTVTIPGPPPVPPVAGTATITDTYTPADGSLLLSKTISGPSAGQQGAVTIDVTCGATTFAPFVIPARTKAGTFTHPVDGIPANSTCTVAETNDGSSSTVVVTVTGAKQSVPVPPGTVVPVEIDDVYSDGPGSLVVTKTLTGPAAGQQGPISILADCGGPETFALDIPAGTAAGSVPQEFDTIPAGSTCTVQETVNGGSDSIAVVAVGSDQTVTIPNGGTASVALVDSFAAVTSAAPTSALAFTGAGAHQLGELAAVLILFGGLAVAGARPETWRRWRARRKQ